MEICFCVDTMSSGGAERVASILCNEFAKAGHAVDLVMVSEREEKTFYPINEDVKLVPLLYGCSSKRHFFLIKIKRLKMVLKKKKYDAVISFLPNVNVCAWLAAPRKRTYVHVVSERNDPYADPKSFVRRILKEMAFRKADGIVCQTNDAKKYYGKKARKPIVVIKNPLLDSALCPSTAKNCDVISVGRLEEQKNFKCLIDAFSVFSKNHSEARLKIYGDGSLRPSLLSQIERLHLKEKVSLCGNSISWASDNINCALFISTSLHEGMPNALLEALGNKMPCIASDCPIGGSRELLSYDNGLLFENDNQNELIAQMELLYHNRELIEKFEANNESIKTRYSSFEISKQWINFINGLIRKREGKRG